MFVRSGTRQILQTSASSSSPPAGVGEFAAADWLKDTALAGTLIFGVLALMFWDWDLKSLLAGRRKSRK